MASINSNTYDGRYMTLTVTQTKGTSSQNYSTINWTLTVSGGNSQYYSTGPTDVVIDGVNRYHSDRKAWNSYAFPAATGSVSGSFRKNHNNDGTCGAIGFSLSTAIYTASVSSWSGSLSMSSIPRYANITTWKLNGYDETSVSCKWGADASCDAIQYSLNGGGWTAWSGYPDATLSGLTPGTSYNIKCRVRRQDSQLWSESGLLYFTTYSYPYCTSAPSFKIGDNVTIGLYNPLNRPVQLQMWSHTSRDFVSDRVSASGTSYTGFSDITDRLYASIPESKNSGYNIDVWYGDNKAIYEGINNYSIKENDSEKPTFDASYITSITNSLNTDISGTDKFIKNHNKLNVIIKPMILNKSAHGKEYIISANGLSTITKTYSTSNISFEMGNMSTNTINVTAYDKRGLYRSVSKTITLVDYNNPTISNVKINRENGIGTKAIINIEGVYTNWSGLLKNNTIQKIQYRTKLSENGAYSSWKDLPSDASININNGVWKVTTKLSDTFVNTSNYDIQFKFNDLLETVESTKYIIGTADAILWRDLANKRIGIRKKPEYELDVNGIISSDKGIKSVHINKMAIESAGYNNRTWVHLCHIKILNHYQGYMWNMNIFAGDGNNGLASQNSRCDLMFQLGWSGSNGGQPGVTCETRTGNGGVRVYNVKVCKQDNYNYDIWVYKIAGYSRFNYNVNFDPTILEITDTSNETSDDEPIGANGNCEVANINIGLNAYPVGSIYISYNATSPASLFGGTWLRIDNAFLWGTSDPNQLGQVGGSSTHRHLSPLTWKENNAHTEWGKFFGVTNDLGNAQVGYTRDFYGAQYNKSISRSDTNWPTTLAYYTSSENHMPPYLVVYIWRRTG